MKSEAIDLVTEGDEAAERLIKANIDAIAPGAVFIGEESVAADPALLDKLAGADLAIVVDPIDGTFNFAAGLPLFGVMASVVAGGETVAGIIYDPLGNDWSSPSGAPARGCAGPTARRRDCRSLPGSPSKTWWASHRPGSTRRPSAASSGQYGEGPDGHELSLRGA